MLGGGQRLADLLKILRDFTAETRIEVQRAVEIALREPVAGRRVATFPGVMARPEEKHDAANEPAGGVARVSLNHPIHLLGRA